MYFGPYVIEAKVGKVAYALRLPAYVNMHPIFYVSLLKKSIEPQATASPELSIVSEKGEEVVEPQVILDKRVVYQGSVPLTQVLVRWSTKTPITQHRSIYLSCSLNSCKL